MYYKIVHRKFKNNFKASCFSFALAKYRLSILNSKVQNNSKYPKIQNFEHQYATWGGKFHTIKFCFIHFIKYMHKPCVVANTYYPSHLGDWGRRITSSRTINQLAKLYFQDKKIYKGNIVSVVESFWAQMPVLQKIKFF